jgi:hypothetical protein
VPALHAAVALVEVHHIALAIAEDLDFDMARVLQVLLDEDVPVSKRRLYEGVGVITPRPVLVYMENHCT